MSEGNNSGGKGNGPDSGRPGRELVSRESHTDDVLDLTPDMVAGETLEGRVGSESAGSPRLKGYASRIFGAAESTYTAAKDRLHSAIGSMGNRRRANAQRKAEQRAHEEKQRTQSEEHQEFLNQRDAYALNRVGDLSFIINNPALGSTQKEKLETYSSIFDAYAALNPQFAQMQNKLPSMNAILETYLNPNLGLAFRIPEAVEMETEYLYANAMGNFLRGTGTMKDRADYIRNLIEACRISGKALDSHPIRRLDSVYALMESIKSEAKAEKAAEKPAEEKKTVESPNLASITKALAVGTLFGLGGYVAGNYASIEAAQAFGMDSFGNAPGILGAAGGLYFSRHFSKNPFVKVVTTLAALGTAVAGGYILLN